MSPIVWVVASADTAERWADAAWEKDLDAHDLAWSEMRPAGSMVSATSSSPRFTRIAIGSAPAARIACWMSTHDSTALPATTRTVSPGCMPARSAGMFGRGETRVPSPFQSPQ